MLKIHNRVSNYLKSYNKMKNLIVKYIDRLCKTDEDKVNEKNTFLAKENEIAGLSELLEIEKEISKIEREIESALGARHNYSNRVVYALECQLKLTQQELKRCKQIQKAQF
jgi:hypothetical protein